MTDVHDLDNSVIAAFPPDADLDALVSDLKGADYDVEVMKGADASEHLDPEGESGFFAGLKRMASRMGDETRILHRLTEALESGYVVVSVRTTDLEPEPAIKRMREMDPALMWRFDDWTHTSLHETPPG